MVCCGKGRLHALGVLDTEAEEVIDRIARPAARVPSAGEPCVTIDLAGIARKEMP